MDGPYLLRKARGHIDQMESAGVRMRDLGHSEDMTAIEAEFFTVLSNFDAAFEALLEASARMDGGRVRGQLLSDRSSKSYLYYLWKARVATHHASGLLQYRLDFRTCHVRVVDPLKNAAAGWGAKNEHDRIQRVMQRVFKASGRKALLRRMNEGAPPDPANCAAAGVELVNVAREMGLKPFSYVNLQGTTESVPAPYHDDPNQPGLASQVILQTLEYLRAKAALIEASASP